jgi:hypothetical protein
MKTFKEMLVIGNGFQHLFDSYFWYLPFASVRQCKYIMEQSRIPEDEWMAKRAALAEEHNTPGACDSLKDGLKAWLQTDLFKQRQGKLVVLSKSTQSQVMVRVLQD